MKRPLVWCLAGIPVLLFATYLALTAGTRLLLPDWWNQIQPGMTKEEIRQLVWMAQVPPESVDPFSDEAAKQMENGWGLSYDCGLWSDEQFLTRRIGLRRWFLFLNFDGDVLQSTDIRTLSVLRQYAEGYYYTHVLRESPTP